MIETLVHTPNGKLESADPFQQVGTRGWYTRGDYKFIVTPACVKRNRDLVSDEEEGKVVNWNTNINRGFWPESNINYQSPNPVSDMRIVEPGDKDYFEVQEHILKGEH